MAEVLRPHHPEFHPTIDVEFVLLHADNAVVSNPGDAASVRNQPRCSVTPDYERWLFEPDGRLIAEAVGPAD